MDDLSGVDKQYQPVGLTQEGRDLEVVEEVGVLDGQEVAVVVEVVQGVVGVVEVGVVEQEVLVDQVYDIKLNL